MEHSKSQFAPVRLTEKKAHIMIRPANTPLPPIRLRHFSPPYQRSLPPKKKNTFPKGEAIYQIHRKTLERELSLQRKALLRPLFKCTSVDFLQELPLRFWSNNFNQKCARQIKGVGSFRRHPQIFSNNKDVSRRVRGFKVTVKIFHMCYSILHYIEPSN